MPKDRWHKLEALGFDRDPLETAWMEGLQHLKAFKKREGHCHVPVSHKENGFSLGQWVFRQRQNKCLSAERRQRLDELGFVWKIRPPIDR